MKVPLDIVLTKNASKTLAALDVPTRKMVNEKIEAVASDPFNPNHSYPLQGTDKRSARVGGYRILLLICDPVLLITDIESRGQVYSRI